MKANSVAFSNDISCESCGDFHSYGNRRDISLAKANTTWTCAECVIMNDYILKQQKVDVLEELLAQSLKHPVSLEQLSARNGVLLLALIRFLTPESLLHLAAFDQNKVDKFSPDAAFSSEILKEMYRANLIAIAPRSNLDTIEIGEDNQFRFHLHQVKWVIPLSINCNPLTFIDQLEKKVSSMDFLESDYETVIDLCKEVSVLECLSYLSLLIREHNFSFMADNETHYVINRALDNFSVSQVFNLIWCSVRNITALYQKSAAAKQYTANAIISNIDSQLDRAITNDWKIPLFPRPLNAPQSILSHTLFDTFLHTKDGGFKSILSKVI